MSIFDRLREEREEALRKARELLGQPADPTEPLAPPEPGVPGASKHVYILQTRFGLRPEIDISEEAAKRILWVEHVLAPGQGKAEFAVSDINVAYDIFGERFPWEDYVDSLFREEIGAKQIPEGWGYEDEGPEDGTAEDTAQEVQPPQTLPTKHWAYLFRGTQGSLDPRLLKFSTDLDFLESLLGESTGLSRPPAESVALVAGSLEKVKVGQVVTNLRTGKRTTITSLEHGVAVLSEDIELTKGTPYSISVPIPTAPPSAPMLTAAGATMAKFDWQDILRPLGLSENTRDYLRRSGGVATAIDTGTATRLAWLSEALDVMPVELTAVHRHLAARAAALEAIAEQTGSQYTMDFFHLIPDAGIRDFLISAGNSEEEVAAGSMDDWRQEIIAFYNRSGADTKAEIIKSVQQYLKAYLPHAVDSIDNILYEHSTTTYGPPAIAVVFEDAFTKPRPHDAPIRRGDFEEWTKGVNNWMEDQKQMWERYWRSASTMLYLELSPILHKILREAPHGANTRYVLEKLREESMAQLGKGYVIISNDYLETLRGRIGGK